MGKISKGFSLTIAILGVLCLIWGICISVISWVLAGKAPASIRHTYDSYSTDSYSIPSYWWGGLGFIIPGVLGIVAGCTRNVVAFLCKKCVIGYLRDLWNCGNTILLQMVFFLIFDILCLLASLGMTIMAALMIAIWDTVNERLGGTCYTTYNQYYDEASCTCRHGLEPRDTWTMDGATCEDLMSIQGMLTALVVLGALAALMSSIASYVSCCSLCNQEQDYHGGVIVQQPGYVAPPSMVFAHTSNVQQAVPQQYPPQEYQPQQHPSTHQVPPRYGEVLQQQYPVSHDKAKLVTNEVA